MKKIIFSGITLITIFLVSCSNEEKTSENEIQITDSLSTQPEEEDKIYSLPSAEHVAVMFKRSNLKYIIGITTKIENKETGGELENTLRLGIYSADLFYNLLNNQWAESEKYFLVCKNYADKIGFNEVFTEETLNRLKTNIQNTDSIIKILSTIQYNLDNKVQYENKNHLIPVAFAGAWIESMYIAVQVSKKGNANPQVNNMITENIAIGNTLLKLLNKELKTDSKIKDIIEIIDGLMKEFNTMQSVQQKFENEEGEISLTKDELDKLFQAIESSHQKLLTL
jgi:hypothetical protein